MIQTRKELRFYIKADEIMNEQVFPQGILRQFFFPSNIQSYLRVLRKHEYYHNASGMLNKCMCAFYAIRHHRIGEKIGFNIPINCLGYGVRIGHTAGVIINGSAKIGNYCCIQNYVTIADGLPKHIGDRVYIGSNVVIAKSIQIADNCTISACTFMNKSAMQPNMLWGGVTAKPLKECRAWIDEEPYKTAYRRIESMRKSMNF